MELKVIHNSQKPAVPGRFANAAVKPDGGRAVAKKAAKSADPADVQVRGAAPGKVRGVGKILSKELVPFTRQLASMSAAGMPILSVLETLRDQCADVNFKAVLVTVTASVEGGSPLSEGLAKFPKVFDETYVNLVIAGEQSGKFAPILKRLADMLQSSAKLKKRVKSAMTYPTVIISLAMVLAGCLIQFVVPVFAEMFAGFGKELPWLTQQMVNISNFVSSWWYVIIPSVAALVWLFRRWKSTERGRYLFDEFKLKLPVFGQLNQKSLISRFARVFSEMLGAGVPVLNAMKIVADALGNHVLRESILAARREVEQGNQLSLSLAEKPYLPVLMTRMLAAGEKAGRVEDMLSSVADTYDEEVDAMLSTLTSLMEPFLMVFLGAVIGTVVAAMFLPIFNMGSLAT